MSSLTVTGVESTQQQKSISLYFSGTNVITCTQHLMNSGAKQQNPQDVNSISGRSQHIDAVCAVFGRCVAGVATG